jgi:hypothetical protein
MAERRTISAPFAAAIDSETILLASYRKQQLLLEDAMNTLEEPSTLAQQIPRAERAVAAGTRDRTDRPHHLLDWRVVTLSLATFFALSYTLCVIHCLIFPGMLRYFDAWSRFLPGFVWLTWGSFFLGLGETVVYGVYVGVVFTAIYNLFAKIFTARE